MANGVGVSIAPLRKTADGRPEPGTVWRVRWREWVERDGERVLRQRERKFHHPKGSTARTAPPAAVTFHADTLRRIEDGDLPDLAPPVRVEESRASFDEAAAAWLRHKAARGVTASTLDKYAQSIARWFGTVRTSRRIEKEAPVPVDLLTRDLFAEVVLTWREAGLSESTVYSSARIVLDAWTWAADDPRAYPGVPPAPRDKSTILPQAPIYAAALHPTLAEADACIRRLHRTSYVARGAAIVMRYTGLRISQVLALQLADLDTGARTLTVRTGKSRRERAAHRVIPVPRALLDDLAPYMGGEPDGSLVRRRSDLRSAPSRSHHPRGSLTAAWEAATVAGEARREVWAPSTRHVARPDHAFRAALQGHLVEAGIRDEVIDAIVGHAGKSTRSRHYAGPAALFDAMREAVDALPPIDWSSAEDEAGNVVAFRG